MAPVRRWLSLLLPIAALFLVALAVWWLLPRFSPTPKHPLTEIDVYFHRRDAPDAPPVAVTRRLRLTETDRVSRVRAAVQALLDGPTAAEKAAGYYASLPQDTRLLGVRVERPYAHLDFDRALERTGGTAKVGAMLDELAYTSCSVSDVKGVILAVEGELVGTEEHPFTGEGFLFDRLHPDVRGAWAKALSPADTLDLFIVAIPDPEEMWALMGAKARRTYGSPAGIDWTAFAEGLGSWRNYRTVSERVEGNEAVVVIAGRQVLEGNVEPNARYEARLVREYGRWKWDLP